MAEEEATASAPVGDEDPEVTPGYQAPKEKSLAEIVDQDQDDEALTKYKQTLLGSAAAGGGGERTVTVQKMIIKVEGRDDIEIDLTNEESKDRKIRMKEGISYRLCLEFEVGGDIVTGLKLHTVIKRKGLKVDTNTKMLGSYPPNKCTFEDKSPEDLPAGLLARGDYVAHCKVVDDDKNKYSEWSWKIELKKDWD